MKKVIIMFALAMGIITANAQENVTVGENNGSEPTNEARAETSSLDYASQGGGRQSQQPTLTKEVYPQKEADGDLYHGLTKKLTFDRMVPPHGLEVTYDKTVHVIFPSEVRYVDLGSPDLIAGKADGAENVIRVKATVEGYRMPSTTLEAKALVKKEAYVAAGFLEGKADSKTEFVHTVFAGNFLETEENKYIFNVRLERPARKDVKVEEDSLQSC